MKKLRWAMDGDFWELDMSTPTTIEGTARAVPGDPLPLGLSRGTRLSRPKQIHFMQRFMAAPFVPSISPSSHGFALQRVLTLPFSDNWFATLLGQFNVQKFVSAIKESKSKQQTESSRFREIGRLLRDQSLYALGFCSEFLLTPEDALLISLDAYGDGDSDNKGQAPRKKAVFHHKFPHHNLIVEAVWPGLFVDKAGNYWDVPLSMAVDLASVASDSGPSYHFSVHHNAGSPRTFEGDETATVSAPLLPGLSLKTAFCYKMNFDIWRSEAQKLKMVQPFDIFLSNPHVSASGVIGAAATACFGENSVRSLLGDDSQGCRGLCLHASSVKSGLLADIFASVSFTAQHGNFQRLFFDLTRFHARFDVPCGSKFLLGATRLGLDLLNSQQPSLEAIHAVCPNATFSLQQQIGGPFSLRVDSGAVIEVKNGEWEIRADKPVFALEYALQALGSAKAVAWYSPKHQEFMVELRFFET